MLRIGGRGGVRMRMVDVGIVLFTIQLPERDMGRENVLRLWCIRGALELYDLQVDWKCLPMSCIKRGVEGNIVGGGLCIQSLRHCR